MNEQAVFQPTVSSPGVFPLMMVDNRPRLYRNCYPDYRRSPVSPFLPTLTFSRHRSDPAGSRILPIPIHGDIPSIRYVPGFLSLSFLKAFLATFSLRQSSSAGTTPLAETLS